MPEPESFPTLGLDAKASESAEAGADVSALQPQHAEAIRQPGQTAGAHCIACRRPILDSYFHIQGQVVCPECSSAIASKQKAPPVSSLGKALLYGLAAATAGCALYAIVAIVTGLELALIAILVGYMVGMAIRKASGGLGGRGQQILAVILTYFSITTSYIPVGIYQYMKGDKQVQSGAAESSAVDTGSSPEEKSSSAASAGSVVTSLLLLVVAAPFLGLSHGFGALISLLIIFFGLQRAWHIAGRRDLVIMGPYQASG
jgi:DNA-directed RNA polymerase subunit RPC12/RpoP